LTQLNYTIKAGMNSSNMLEDNTQKEKSQLKVKQRLK